MLLVSLSLWKETTFCIHCSPVLGESGWMYMRLGISGSALPAITHRELWNLYLQSSAATMSINIMYLAFLSKPETRMRNEGNILSETNTYLALHLVKVMSLQGKRVLHNKPTFELRFNVALI